MKKKSRIKCEPLRLFRYSLDGGRSWLTVASAVRGHTVSAVRRGLETRHGFPVMVRAAGGSKETWLEDVEERNTPASRGV